MTERPSPVSSPTSSNPNEIVLDKSFYTWSTFFRGLVGMASKDEIRMYNSVQQALNEDKYCKRCEENRDWAFQYSPIVRFMREQAQSLGHDIPPEVVRCRPCRNLPHFGGFDPAYGITLCSDQLAFRGRKKLEDTLAHEMIHAYDYLRFNIDRNNMKHQACSEIRAAMLSGECRFVNEFWKRGQYTLTRQFQECIRRRAVLSLMGRPAIKGKEEAESYVDQVWDNCFKDTRPFDEVYK